MTLNQLLYFQILAEEMHMGHAAERLLIAQPSLSISIAKLEEELGVLLFDRNGHRLSLTKAGEIFREHVDTILKEVDDTYAEMKRFSKEQEHKIHIGCIAPVFHSFLSECMGQFLQKEKKQEIRISFDFGLTPELIEGLKKGNYDFIICSEIQDSEIVQIPILEEPLQLLLPNKDCGQNEWQKVSWKELERRPMIGYDQSSAMNQIIDRIAREKKLIFEIPYRLPDERSIAELVSKDFGWAIVPRVPDLEEYEVCLQPLPDGEYVRKICLTTLRSKNHTHAAQRFKEYLIKTIKKEISFSDCYDKR